MVDSDRTEVDFVRALATAAGLELDDARAEQLAAALQRYRGQVARLDRLELDEWEPGVADPSAGR